MSLTGPSVGSIRSEAISPRLVMVPGFATGRVVHSHATVENSAQRANAIRTAPDASMQRLLPCHRIRGLAVAVGTPQPLNRANMAPLEKASACGIGVPVLARTPMPGPKPTD